MIDRVDQDAAFRVARHDGWPVTFASAEQSGERVESQFAFLLIFTVALVAVFREYRANSIFEKGSRFRIDLCGRLLRCFLFSICAGSE